MTTRTPSQADKRPPKQYQRPRRLEDTPEFLEAELEASLERIPPRGDDYHPNPQDDPDLEGILTPPPPRQAGKITSAEVITRLEKATQAVELRKQGLSYREIAEQLNYSSPQHASREVLGLLREMVGEPTEELRNLEAARIDELWFEVRDVVMTVDSPLLKLYGVDRLIKLSERRSKLLGLDAPVKVNIEVKVRQMAQALGLDPDQAVDELRSVVSWSGKQNSRPSLGSTGSSEGSDRSENTNPRFGGLGLIKSDVII